MESRRIAAALLVLRLTIFFVTPRPNILFFAAWPMLGACFALYYLRDLDTLCRVRSSSRVVGQ